MSGGVTIAVDGPAASGKSTLARRLADVLGYHFLDTGLLYRATAERLLRLGGDPGDEATAARLAEDIDPAALDSPSLADQLVGEWASRVAVLPEVRGALLAFQRRFAGRRPGAVLAGRDIGTVVCPEAAIKIFVTASVEERARRRYEQLRARGEPVMVEAVLDELKQRDRRDSERAVAPLRVSDDAQVLDTTSLDADAAFMAAFALVRAHPRFRT